MWYVLAVLIGVTLYALYEGRRVRRLIRRVPVAERYTQENGTRSLLVLGDSTAVGTGARTPHESLAGRLGVALNASVENYAENGAITADMKGQLAGTRREHYDCILIQVGANDVIQFRSLAVAESELHAVLESAAQKSAHLIVLTAGKIGNAPLFPRLIAPILTMRARALRSRFMHTASSCGALYIDLYNVPDPFAEDPDRYYAPDGLHLTGDGYGFWFDQTKWALSEKWPDILVHAT